MLFHKILYKNTLNCSCVCWFHININGIFLSLILTEFLISYTYQIYRNSVKKSLISLLSLCFLQLSLLSYNRLFLMDFQWHLYGIIKKSI